ncbi:MAG: VCBS repeat-containing protein [Acidobacteria bacterium]|nr:VCBS repeat-containing protein [Acidobacteriota bacterium]MCA1611355.1 VCBS repeat-containing protein [Acidobacteriota bacterium]
MNRTPSNLTNLSALGMAAAVALGIWACTSSSPSKAAPSASSSAAPGGSLTPTPSARRRVNPDVIEEDETHFVERFRKKDYIRVDERHMRSPIVPLPVEFFKEDETYYYVWTPKILPEQAEAQENARPRVSPTAPAPARTPVAPVADFDDLAPQRGTVTVRFEELAGTGLPAEGLWRASFVMADMNGDGILDVVAPPARLGGDGKPHVWLGDGKGHYTAWPLSFVEDGRKRPDFAVDYGGIAAGDIDGDGNMDIATASHNGGLVALFGDGKGGFTVSRRGLPARDFSSQGIALIDVNGDGRFDIVASRDILDNSGDAVDLNQVRTYLYKSPRAWEFRSNSLPGAAYSYSMNVWDYDRDGKIDLLTGSHVFGAQTLLWKNGGKGEFLPIAFPELESYAFHFSARPGTFGAGKQPAFVDAYSKFMQEPLNNAIGLNVYSLKDGAWTVHRVFRKKGGNAFLYAVGMGDVNGDGLDDVVFPDSEMKKVRIFLQSPDGQFREIPAAQEPPINSQAQCLRLVDVNGDGRLDIVIAKTIPSSSPTDPGGFSVYLNRP